MPPRPPKRRPPATAPKRAASDNSATVLPMESERVNPFVLRPAAEPMAMYHWEADQEAFLVVSGEAVLIIEGEERQLRAWDFVHCPPNTKRWNRVSMRALACTGRWTAGGWTFPSP